MKRIKQVTSLKIDEHFKQVLVNIAKLPSGIEPLMKTRTKRTNRE